MTQTMKAWCSVPGPDGAVFELRETSVADPGPGQVLVAVHAAGTNRGELIRGAALRSGGPVANPARAGGEFAGEIAALGAGVSGWKPGDPAYKVARLLCRARYYNGTPRGVTRMWFNMYGATPGSVKGQESREDKLAKSPETNYQAMFRGGSHQSGTRAWIKPTLITDSLVRKGVFGQAIGKGFEPDVHCPTGAPRESFVKITKAEPGGLGGQGLWRPASQGLRPTYQSDEMKEYLSGAFVDV